MAIQEHQKGIVALVMAILLIIEDWTGWSTGGITEEWVITILGVLTPIVVWLTPNKKTNA